jgi:hypothetical protein
MKKIFVALVLIACFSASAQIKIGANPTSLKESSLLELESIDKGVLFPRLALTSTTAWAPLAGEKVMGMTVYNTETTGDVTPGLYTNNGSVWVKNETAGFQVQKSRVHSANTAIQWLASDYSVVTTSLGNLSLILLPDATTLPDNSVRCISNHGAGNAGWDSTAIAGITRSLYPSSIATASSVSFVTIAGKWYLYSGR